MPQAVYRLWKFVSPLLASRTTLFSKFLHHNEGLHHIFSRLEVNSGEACQDILAVGQDGTRPIFNCPSILLSLIDKTSPPGFPYTGAEKKIQLQLEALDTSASIWERRRRRNPLVKYTPRLDPCCSKLCSHFSERASSFRHIHRKITINGDCAYITFSTNST